MAEKPQPVRVLYCGVCGLPAEYCEFGPDFERCKPWLLQHAPDLYPDLLKGTRLPLALAFPKPPSSFPDRCMIDLVSFSFNLGFRGDREGGVQGR